MVKSKSLSDILKENPSLSRKVSVEEIENQKVCFDDSAIEKNICGVFKSQKRRVTLWRTAAGL